MTLDQRSSTDWDIQDANRTDWRADARTASADLNFTDTLASMVVSDTPPSDPQQGDLWWYTGDGNLYVWYNDGSSADWVIANSMVPPVISVFGRTGDIVARVGDYESAQVSIAPLLSLGRPYDNVRDYLEALSADTDAALQTAGDASSEAAQASADAATALSTANAVDSKATTALDNANAAQSTANAASSAANAAQSTANAAMPIVGGTFTGLVTLSGPPTTALHSATKAYVDGFAPSWTVITGKPTTIAGYGITDAYTKAQVDTTTAALMPKAGGTFTGAVTFGTTDAATLPAGTTAQRPTGTAGQIRYNSQLGTFEGYSTSWGPIGGGVSIGTTPPASPQVGAQWFDSEDGNTYLWYDDGNSQQWVPASAGTALAFDASGYLSAADNLVINGGMDFAQRGVTFNNRNDNVPTYTLDRWRVFSSAASGNTQNVVQSQFSPGTALASGEMVNYVMWLNRTAAANTTYISQPIEDVRTANGQTVVVSLVVQFPSAGNFTVQFNQNFGGGGSASTYTSSGSLAVPANTLTRVTTTVAIPSISGKTMGTNSNLEFYVVLPPALGTGSFYIGNVDIRLGTLAPKQFLRRSIDQELAMCQRYYQVYNGVLLGSIPTGTAVMDFSLPVVMRAQPSIITSNISYTNANTLTMNSSYAAHTRFQVAISAAQGSVTFTFSADAEL